MKKLMIAFLCCFGVGFAMMASPAQMSDDNIAVDEKNTTAVQANVAKRNDVSKNGSTPLIKHVWKAKKFFVSPTVWVNNDGLTHGVLDLKTKRRPYKPGEIMPQRPPMPVPNPYSVLKSKPVVQGRPDTSRPPRVWEITSSDNGSNDSSTEYHREPIKPGGIRPMGGGGLPVGSEIVLTRPTDKDN